MMAAAKFVLAIALGVLVSATSATAPKHGTMELCERLHVITVNSYTDGVMVKYMYSKDSEILTTTFQGHYLPPPSICGDGYKRCNLHITSNYNRSIRVVIVPLSSGIGLISYNHLADEDMLVYREQFVLTQISPNCTYIYFTETREVVGYCLDLSSRDQPYMYSMRIGIQHDSLRQSVVKQHNVGERVGLINLASLSNFVFFDFNQDPNNCFSNEDGHVVCLENGEVLDHSFSDEQFTYTNPHIHACSSASQLLHAGTTCKLVAHCGPEVFLFQIHQQEPTILSNGSSGQVFVCPDLQFVRSRIQTLSLHAENGTQTRKLASFPLERICQGDCLIINNHYVFFATLVDGSTLLANFTSSTYRQLGVSKYATYIPSRVKGEIGLVQNGNNTLVYNLNLPCQQEPTVIPNNFILANHFSTGTREQWWYTTDSGPSISIHQTTVIPTAENNQTSATPTSQELVIPLSVILLVVIVVVLLLGVLIIIIFYMKQKESKTSSGESGIQLHHVNNPLIQNNKGSGVELDMLSNGDQKSTASESSECGGSTMDPLLESPRLESSCLSEIENSNLQLRHERRLPTWSTIMHVHVDRETGSVNYMDDHDSQLQATSSGFQYPHRHLQGVGRENTTAVQCTSPRSSFHGSAGDSSLQHAANVVMLSQRFSVNDSAVSLGQRENSDVTDNRLSLHSFRPIEATSGSGGDRSYMTAPQHFLASGANPHPDDIQRIRQQREGRANEEDFQRLMVYAPANGEPNNDVIRVEQQRSGDSAENNRNGPPVECVPVNGCSHYFQEARDRARIPFMSHQVVQCDSDRKILRLIEHDIIVIIPEGAIPVGKKLHLEVAVAVYGPFTFSELSARPISPILWLCFLESDVQLSKPFQVILPHFLIGLTSAKAWYYDVGFAKANHDNSLNHGGQMCYNFITCDGESEISVSDGTLTTRHCCFLCIKARRITCEIAKEASYCLVRITHSSSLQQEIYFTAIFYLSTCIKALRKQFPDKKGYNFSSFNLFKFNDGETPFIKIAVEEQDEFLIAMEPQPAKIKAYDIDFWERNLTFSEMRRRHETRVYPPRVKMTVARPHTFVVSKLTVKFPGSDCDDIELMISLGMSGVARQAPLLVTSSTARSEASDLRSAFEFLHPIASEWKNIGVLLNIHYDELTHIEADEQRVDECLAAMLSKWVNQIVDRRPAWSDLIRAVELCRHPNIAETIRNWVSGQAVTSH